MTGNRSSPGTPDRTPVVPVLTRASVKLGAAGVASPRVDAELIAASVLDVSRGRLLTVSGFDPGALARFEGLVDRRAAGEPVQHLTGEAGFRHLVLSVGPGVFIPRPETELLVDRGLAALDAGREGEGRRPVVVDLCAGSGALGLSVAVERPGVTVYLVERDAAALRYLTANAERVAVGVLDLTEGVPQNGTRIEVVAGDATDPAVPPGLDGTVDLVLCNPPYLLRGVPLPSDVSGGDPDVALYGGADGLSVIRPLVGRIAALLRPGGTLALEHDDTHGTAVPDLLRADGRFAEVTGHADLTGRPRFATARRAPAGAPDPG